MARNPQFINSYIVLQHVSPVRGLRYVDAMLQLLSSDGFGAIHVTGFPDKLQAKGKKSMREGYTLTFSKAPQLHCEVVNRIVLGNTVIDRERVTGLGDRTLESIAIYTVTEGKISRVTFIF